MQLASGLGDYIGARKYLYDHINKGLREEYNIIVIGTKRLIQFANYLDKENVDILIYIDNPYGKKLGTREKIIQILPKADIYIDIILVPSDNYVIPDYISSDVKYRIIDYNGLEKLSRNKGYIYGDGYEWLFNHLKPHYKLQNNSNPLDVWKLNKKDSIDETIKKHITNGYIVIFAEGFSRGSLSDEQIKCIIDYLLKNTNYDIVLCGIIKKREEINKFLANIYGNDDRIKKRVYNYYRKIKTYQIPKIVAKSSLLITTDTAPYHIGIQLNKYTICITNYDYFSLNYNKSNIYNIVMEKNNLSEIPIENIQDALVEFISQKNI